MMQLISSVKRRMGQSSREGHHTSQPDHAHVATPTAQQTTFTNRSHMAQVQPFMPLNNSDLLHQDSFGSVVNKSCDVPKPSEDQQRQATSPSSPKKNGSEMPGLLVCNTSPDLFAREPYLREVPSNDVLDVLRRKLEHCRNVIFDFKAPHADMWTDAKEAKKSTLTEILDFVTNTDRRTVHLEQVVEELIAMISANIFRPLPPPANTMSSMLLNDPEELEPILEVSWPHLSLVYEILLKFVMSSEVNPKTTKKYIDHSFVLKLLDLFASEDPRERDYLKTIMHRVYGKIMALRAFIRKAIQHVFFCYVHEDDSQHGVSELLEILGSIINGFAQPLKEEHKLFLRRSMIPLHKSRHLVSYHQQLTYCMTQYIEKDNKLVEPIIKGLLRYWPVTNTPKEVLFLNEVEEILELTPAVEFTKIMEPLFQRMALCIQSPHFQVSERVLFLWNNTRIVKLIHGNKEQLFPIVIGALYKNTKDHWNVTVHGLTFNVCKLLAEADPNLFDHVNDENVKNQERKGKDRERRQQMWQTLKRNCEEKDAAGNNNDNPTSSET